MPNDRIEIETDGDPKTEYEDVENHERTGFLIAAEENAAQGRGGKNRINAPIVREEELRGQ